MVRNFNRLYFRSGSFQIKHQPLRCMCLIVRNTIPHLRRRPAAALCSVTVHRLVRCTIFNAAFYPGCRSRFIQRHICRSRLHSLYTEPTRHIQTLANHCCCKDASGNTFPYLHLSSPLFTVNFSVSFLYYCI